MITAATRERRGIVLAVSPVPLKTQMIGWLNLLRTLKTIALFVVKYLRNKRKKMQYQYHYGLLASLYASTRNTRKVFTWNGSLQEPKLKL